MDDLQLRERNRQALPLPTHHHEHLSFAFFFGGYLQYIDLVSHLKRRGRSFGDAPGEEWKGELVLEVAVPSHGPFFFAIGIDDDLHLDPMLSGLIRFYS